MADGRCNMFMSRDSRISFRITDRGIRGIKFSIGNRRVECRVVCKSSVGNIVRGCASLAKGPTLPPT